MKNDRKSEWKKCDGCHRHYSVAWEKCKDCSHRISPGSSPKAVVARQEPQPAPETRQKLMYSLNTKPSAIPYLKEIFLVCSVVIALAIGSEYYSRRQAQVAATVQTINQCATDFAVNNCGSPVPALMDYCANKQRCQSMHPEGQIHSLVILSEMVNDVARGFVSLHGLMVLGVGLLALWILRQGVEKEVKVVKVKEAGRVSE